MSNLVNAGSIHAGYIFHCYLASVPMLIRAATVLQTLWHGHNMFLMIACLGYRRGRKYNIKQS